MSSETVVFTSSRVARAQRVQAARHVVIGLMLAASGLEAFRAGHHATWIDGVAIVSGVLLLGAFVVEVRQARRRDGHAHHGIGWVDVFASVVTAVEAAHLYHKGKSGLPFVYLLLAVILLGLGLAHGRLRRVRRLVVDEQGFDIRLSPWRRLQRRWADVADVSAAGQVVTVTGRSGQAEVLDLRSAPEAEAVVEALTRHATTALAARPSPEASPSADGTDAGTNAPAPDPDAAM